MNRSIIVILILTLLSACSNAPSKPASQPSSKPVADVVQSDYKDSLFYIQQAEEAPRPESQQSFYILAAKSAIAEKKPVIFIRSILNKVDTEKRHTVMLDIELAKALLYVDDINSAESIITRLQSGTVSPRFNVPLRVLDTQLKSIQERHLEVIRNAFQLQTTLVHQLSASDKVLINHLTWKHILEVPYSTLTQFKTDFGSASDAWIELANIINNYLTNPEQIVERLARWQRLYPNTLNKEQLPQQVQELLSVSPYQPVTIALLLPLSGKLSKIAESIRDGFLTAKPFDSLVTVHILDTGLLSLPEIENKITEFGVDFIVGPLEKETVIAFSQSSILQAIPQLSLNMPELIPAHLPNTPANYYFSLAPEDEIEQAIEYFLEKDVTTPAVIYADNNLGRRLFERFNASWHAATGHQAESIAFKSRSKLGDAVQELLDVDKSQARINEMEKLFGAQLKTEPRSRADIDAVYVIANSQLTRLIKPFFDVNISAFGKRLPIYASSSSYVVDEALAQKRDLNGLVFTEMPWLIKNTEPQLSALYDKIGEQQTELKKLFAFGHDAYRLIFALKQLSILPSQSLSGLTGRLSVNDNLTIKRQLSWSRYTRGKVIALPDQKSKAKFTNRASSHR